MSSPANAIAHTPLAGAHVRLEPLTLEHVDALCAVGLDPAIWRWYTHRVNDAAEMRAWVETALAWQAAGTALPYATIERATGRVIGSTRFMNIDAANRRGEIGATWIARPWQRTPINTEAKYLMLQHAFETLGWIRVELKTDSLNEQSRSAILRLGALYEGMFRNHMICDDGRLRHSVWYSIIVDEWPEKKAALQAKLAR